MNRQNLYRAFVEKWTHPNYRPVPQTEDALNAVEQRLDIKFPAAYREYMVGHGAGGPTIRLLDAIVEQELDIHDIGEVYSADSIVQVTSDLRQAGMPDGFVAIASDSLGNQFCFSVEECGRTTEEDAPMWFFDHDFVTIERITSGFEKWIEDLYEIPNDA